MRSCVLVLMLALACAAGGCTTTGSSSRDNPANGRSGVTIFGDIDAGVSRTR